MGERRCEPLIQTVINLDHCNKFCILKSIEQNETTRRALWSEIRPFNWSARHRVNDLYHNQFNRLQTFTVIFAVVQPHSCPCRGKA